MKRPSSVRRRRLRVSCVARKQAKYRRVLPDVAVRRNNVQGSMEGWAAFCEDMQQFYGLDLGSLSQVCLASKHRCLS